MGLIRLCAGGMEGGGRVRSILEKRSKKMDKPEQERTLMATRALGKGQNHKTEDL